MLGPRVPGPTPSIQPGRQPLAGVPATGSCLFSCFGVSGQIAPQPGTRPASVIPPVRPSPTSHLWHHQLCERRAPFLFFPPSPSCGNILLLSLSFAFGRRIALLGDRIHCAHANEPLFQDRHHKPETKKPHLPSRDSAPSRISPPLTRTSPPSTLDTRPSARRQHHTSPLFSCGRRAAPRSTPTPSLPPGGCDIISTRRASAIPPSCLRHFSSLAPSLTTWAPILRAAETHSRPWRTRPAGGGDLAASSRSTMSPPSRLSS